jgi:glutamyl-Q tRNA(Asp) synthetase
VAALASWLDARAHAGQWLVRIEDVDSTRCLPGMDRLILQQLAALGLVSDQPPVYQSQRSARYQAALDLLAARKLAYPCACSRKDIEEAWAAQGTQRARHGELIYPGTCRNGLHGRDARAWRMRVDSRATESSDIASESGLEAITEVAFDSDGVVHWTDRRLGAQSQDVAREVGDFVLRRADGLFAYQLAVVVDDADQHITHVVRGEDLADNTARQIVLQRALGLPTPSYLHTPLVLGANGEKLSKQNGAAALDTGAPLTALNAAARTLDLSMQTGTLAHALAVWTGQWGARFGTTSPAVPTQAPAG